MNINIKTYQEIPEITSISEQDRLKKTILTAFVMNDILNTNVVPDKKRKMILLNISLKFHINRFPWKRCRKIRKILSFRYSQFILKTLTPRPFYFLYIVTNRFLIGYCNHCIFHVILLMFIIILFNFNSYTM